MEGVQVDNNMEFLVVDEARERWHCIDRGCPASPLAYQR